MNCDQWLQVNGRNGEWLNLTFPPKVQPCGRGYRVKYADGSSELVSQARGRRLLAAIGHVRHIPTAVCRATPAEIEVAS